MASSRRREDESPPFFLKLFYRTGSLIRVDEFERSGLPVHVNVYARLSDTLTDLALSLAVEAPRILPELAANTRLVFQLVYTSPSTSQGPERGGFQSRGPRYTVEDLGSVVIGGQHTGGMRVYGPKEDTNDQAARDEEDEYDGTGAKTLGDLKFVVGDYIVVAVLPPREDGGVASAESAKRARGWERSGLVAGSFDGARRGGGGSGIMGGWMGGMMPRVGDWRKGEALHETWDRPPARRGRGRW